MNLKQLDDLGIKYVIKPIQQRKTKSKTKRRIAMSFLASGKLSIRYSPGMTNDEIFCFIDKNLKWIIRNYELKQLKPRQFNDDETYLYLGKHYKLIIYQSNHPEVLINSDQIIIYSKCQNYTTLYHILDDWKTKMAEIIFNELLMQAFIKMSSFLPKFPTLQIKNYQSRWGCCYYKSNKIILNRSLIHVPLCLIEYVIYHELAHLVYPNHSEKFHQFLKQFIPNEKALKRELAKYRPQYQ